MSTQYHSTRGQAPILNFDDAVLAGLASDGGLYVPDALPHFSPAQFLAMAKMDYPTLAAEILWPFVSGELPVASGQSSVVSRQAETCYHNEASPGGQPEQSGDRRSQPSPQREPEANSSCERQNVAQRSKETNLTKAQLLELLCDSYASFRHEAIAPLKQLGSDDWLLELFHGPTLAFKDFALQFLGRLLDHLLAERGEQVTVLGATSGDTGSAAIDGCRGRERMRIFILHPHERVSPIQRRQMTTIHDANVQNIAIQGSFDDCQNIVKALFTQADFRESQRLTAVNSINWARIIAQIVYYVYAALRLGAPAKEVHFCVPTGNFGDIYAGYLAKRMGLPVGKLIIASNRNDILTRCVATGDYRGEAVVPSLSPSMDIQISSNFERLLFEFYDRDAQAIQGLMQQLKSEGGFTLPRPVHQKLQQHFLAMRADDPQTQAAIRSVYETTGEVLDPHSAVGIAAAQAFRAQLSGPIVTLATAHPAKFPDAVKGAIGVDPALPPHLADIWQKEERFTILPADAAAVRDFVVNSNS